jgi:uncharacterized protein involved in oxidation of intracellular sulfur
MNVLIITRHKPYDGTDVVWNALRLAGTLSAGGDDVFIFVMNDSVDIVRESIKPPADYFDLAGMIKELIANGITVRACGTCLERTGSKPGKTAFDGVIVSDLNDLSNWIRESDRLLVF